MRPPSSSFPASTGHDHSLDEYGDAKLLVLVQSCNHCPYVLAWEDRLMAIARDYSHEGVRVVAVNSNDVSRYPEDSFEQMKARAEKRGFPFDYSSTRTSRSRMRSVPSDTPEVFLFDEERQLRYHGAIDDSRDESAVTQSYLRDAIDALLDGDEPPVDGDRGGRLHGQVEVADGRVPDSPGVDRRRRSAALRSWSSAVSTCAIDSDWRTGFPHIPDSCSKSR